MAVVESRLGRPAYELEQFPRFVDIDVTNQCNADCIMCGIDFSRQPTRRMSPELFSKLVRELDEHAGLVERVGLAVNSEPLLDARLADKIRQLKLAGVRQTYVNTNASLLDEQRGAELLRAGLDTTYISIDSLDKGTFEAIRRRLSFDRVYRNARRFLSLKKELRPSGKVRIAMTVLDANRDEAEAFVAAWRELLGPGDEVVLTPAFPWGAWGRDTEGEPDPLPCIALWSSIVISSDGRVPLCCMDAEEETILGDVSRESIADVWHSPELARIRSLHLADRRRDLRLCRNCRVWAEDKHVLRGAKAHHA